jgi:GNAT superfamily N-acetyltransferase
MPQSVLDSMDLGATYAGWWPFLRLRPSRRHSAIVAGRTGVVVGLAVTGPCRDDDVNSANTGELSLLYVDPLAMGLRLGKRLLDAAVAKMRDNGFTDLRLWVLQGNAHARSFYERNGWWHDGGIKSEDVGGGSIVEVRYRLGS